MTQLYSHAVASRVRLNVLKNIPWLRSCRGLGCQLQDKTSAAGSRAPDYDPVLSTCPPFVVAPHMHLFPTCRVSRSRSQPITAATTEPKADVEVVKVSPESTEKNGNGKAPSPPPPKLPEIPAPVQKPFVQVLGQKLLDTGDDILMHATRAFQGHAMETATIGGLKKVDGMDVYVSNKPIILVLGFGWAAHSLAKARSSLS